MVSQYFLKLFFLKFYLTKPAAFLVFLAEILSFSASSAFNPNFSIREANSP